MDSLQVGLADRSYLIQFGEEVLDRIGNLCRELNLGTKVAMVTNPTVGALYGGLVASALSGAGYAVTSIEIPDGEEYKNSSSLHAIYDSLIDFGMERNSFILALGGGVVGDIAGFAAATYLRGIPFIQVPTTLLAQVDSSVGGKTGINHAKGKNLIGAFYQPRLVLVDVSTLYTLPDREYRGGLGEIVKYGVVLDAELFEYLTNHSDRLLARDREALLFVIRRCCAIKAGIVEQDETESGVRAVLNYGHTMGHAVETLTGYRTYSHGEAVAIGMVQAARFSQALGLASGDDTRRIAALLHSLGLPTDLPGFDEAEYREVLMRDKKVRDGGINFVFNRGVGDFEITRITDVSPLFNGGGKGE
ncbi:3-dehydroquinate synthase [Geobacter sp. DSM 9736]|uniref:3-dehydroquinate synthase n=1 Tax=Geobacter sp. DSM 9736 TaxID=1277350 RepID=UPI000B514078|nr:3-dehydroquinate synthase [Geobacter sp. DSM 9736]SNB46185.1 3-dehydroquinate synthase [Geobacter sp. DSM 9736]